MTPPPVSYTHLLVVLDASADVEKIAGMVDFVFCAVDMKKEEIRALEETYAKAEVPVVSNNSAHRWTDDVPMVVPEMNPEHLAVIPAQRARLGTRRGFIAVKSNCSIQSYAPVSYTHLIRPDRRVTMLTYDLDRRGTIPRYDYLCRCIRDDILCGRLTAGSRLPSRRSLAEHLKVCLLYTSVWGAEAGTEGAAGAGASAGVSGSGAAI